MQTIKPPLGNSSMTSIRIAEPPKHPATAPTISAGIFEHWRYWSTTGDGMGDYTPYPFRQVNRLASNVCGHHQRKALKQIQGKF